jgi:AraC family transcriptional regulator
MTSTKRIKRDSYGIEEEAAAALEATRSIEFIEAHLFENLTAARVAEACSKSEFHFSRRFSRRQGESVMSYVRGRRLDFAAKRLLIEPASSVLEIALDCRFESQAAFTRAFTRAFGVSPLKYRRSSELRGRKRRIAMIPAPVLEESFEFVDTFCVAGLSGRFDPSTYVRVSDLWKSFVSHGKFEGQLGEGETCGIFRNRDFASQSFEHLAGARVNQGIHPEGLETWTLPGRNYLVFKQQLVEGELHPQVAAAQSEIWTRRLPASGRTLARAPDFQIYPAKFRVGPGGWLAYYIPCD